VCGSTTRCNTGGDFLAYTVGQLAVSAPDLEAVIEIDLTAADAVHSAA
jgi:hypothetical protein